MKKVLFLFFIFLFLGIFLPMQAKGAIIYHDGPTVQLVEELPAEAMLEGKHINMGIMFDQFGIFWLPIWNYGEAKYVLISDDEETYWDLSDEELKGVKSEYNIELPDEPKLSWWNKIGGKPLAIILLLLIVRGWFSKRN